MDTVVLETFARYIASFEGFSPVPYKPKGEKDTGDNYTIGYGRFGVSVHHPRITESEGFAMLMDDLSRLSRKLDILLSKHSLVLSDTRYLALLDFCYNLGYSRFVGSTLWSCLSSHSRYLDDEITEQFMRWTYSGKKVLHGLVLRCKTRVSLWLADTDYTILKKWN